MTDPIQAIVIVDSDQPTVELYARELSREYHVLTGRTERQVLDLLGTRTISAVVLEPALDGGAGWQILAAIRRAEYGRSIPIVVCSTLDQRTRGMDFEIDAYLVKPTLPITLRETLRRVLPTN